MTPQEVVTEMEQLRLVEVEDFLDKDPSREEKIEYLVKLADIGMYADAAYEQVRMSV